MKSMKISCPNVHILLGIEEDWLGNHTISMCLTHSSILLDGFKGTSIQWNMLLFVICMIMMMIKYSVKATQPIAMCMGTKVCSELILHNNCLTKWLVSKHKITVSTIYEFQVRANNNPSQQQYTYPLLSV